MGRYVFAFATPKDDHSRVLKHFSTHRVGGFFDLYATAFPRISTPESVLKAQFSPGCDLKLAREEHQSVTVLSAYAWLGVTYTYRMDFNLNSDGLMYVDDMTMWLVGKIVNRESIENIEILCLEEE